MPRQGRSSLARYHRSIWCWCHQGAISQVATDVVASHSKQYLMTQYSFSTTFSLKWECLFPLFSDLKMPDEFYFGSIFQTSSDPVSNPDGKTLSGKLKSSCSVYFDTLLTWTQRSLCDWGWNCGCWQKSFKLTGQIKHGPTGEAEGSCRQPAGEIWPKTRREPISVTDWIIELEALTFFTHFSEWEMKNYTQEIKEHLLIWICSVN